MSLIGDVVIAHSVYEYLAEFHPDLMARMRHQVEVVTDAAVERARELLPPRYRAAVRSEVTRRGDELIGSVWISGREARDYAQGFEGMVDVRAHVRETATVFGRPVAPVEQHVRQHSRLVFIAKHVALHFLVEGIAEDLFGAGDLAVAAVAEEAP